MVHQAGVGQVIVPANGQSVGDAVDILDFQGRPIGTGCLQDPGLLSVGQEEGIVVGEGLLKATVATLAMPGQEFHHEIQGLPAVFATLQGQAEHVHTQEALLGLGFTGEDGLITDIETIFIAPHLCPPDPMGLEEDGLIGFLSLINGQVGGLELASGRMTASGNPDGQEMFIGLAVSIFGQDDPAVHR